MEALLIFLPGAMLVFARVVSMIGSMVFLGSTWETRWARLLLAVGLTVILFVRNMPLVPLPAHFGDLIVLIGREVVLGVAMGFSIQTVFMVLKIAGLLLGHEMGFSMSQVMDPTTGFSSPVMGRFFETLCYLFLLSVDGHHRIFEILAGAFDRIPVGRPYDLEVLKTGLIALTSHGINLAFSLAFPIWGALMLVSATLLVMSRAVPQVHLMEFAFALRILTALLVMTWFMSTSAPFIFNIFQEIFQDTYDLVGELGRSG